MKETTKHSIRRVLASLGIRFQKYNFYKFPVDKNNYPDLADIAEPIIFDVGANIGQTAIWFRKEFPKAKIFCFEPFSSVFRELEKNVQHPNTSKYRMALGERNELLQVTSNPDPFCQTGRMELSKPDSECPTEQVEIATIDTFVNKEKISAIHILKSDTEGSDLKVLKGGIELFKAGKIANVLVEASIDRNDSEHSNLFTLIAFLRQYNMTLYSLYDLNHNRENGRLQYFNALFKKE